MFNIKVSLFPVCMIYQTEKVTTGFREISGITSEQQEKRDNRGICYALKTQLQSRSRSDENESL